MSFSYVKFNICMLRRHHFYVSLLLGGGWSGENLHLRASFLLLRGGMHNLAHFFSLGAIFTNIIWHYSFKLQFRINFFLLFFTRVVTSHLLRFFFIWYTVKFPGPVQVTVGEPDSIPGQLRPLSGVAQLNKTKVRKHILICWNRS
jgi:hypothetical protein